VLYSWAMRMRRIIVVLAALLALSNAPAYAATRTAAFSVSSAACVCLISEETQPEQQAHPLTAATSVRPLVLAPRMVAEAETETRFQRPPPSR